MQLVKLTPKEFKRLAKVVYDRAGIHLSEEKLSLLSNRLRKRLKALDLATFKQYETLLRDAKKCDEEFPHFLSAVTTNETYFFRNDQLWKYFFDELIPYFVASKKGRSRALRIWSAASSSGEEAYTTAIALREKLSEISSWNITIIGSDISPRVLEKAQTGVYDDYAVNKLSKERVRRWFTSKDGKHQLRDEVRNMVKFQAHNLRDGFRGPPFDLVFLRNVLMYFDTPMKLRVIDVVTAALAPGGHLIVGDVDPIRTCPELREHMACDYVRNGVYRKPGGVAAAASRKRALTI